MPISAIAKSKRFYIAASVVAALVIMALDFHTDADIDAGVLYIVVVFMSISFCDTRGVIIVALCCAILSLIGWYFSLGDIWGVPAIVNRLLGLLAVGFTTYLGLKDRMAQIELQEAWTQLSRANRVATVGELTSSIAHEIKQPITGIINDASVAMNWLAAQPPVLHDMKEALEGIVSAAERANEVMDGIRALVKKEPMRKVLLNLNDVIAEVLLLCHSELQRNRISVQTHLATDLWPVPGDRIHLQQVLLNLILNAVESMRESDAGRRKVVIISKNEGSNGVVVTIRDFGQGLSADDCAKVFTAFYTSKPGGLGMGLTISRSIVERHAGRLSAIQNEGSGATFQMWLPIDSQAGSVASQLHRLKSDV